MRARSSFQVPPVQAIIYVLAFFVCTFFAGKIWHSTAVITPCPEHQRLHAADLQQILDARTSVKEPDGASEIKPRVTGRPRSILEEVAKTHDTIRALDKSISSLEMELAAARAAKMKHGNLPDNHDETTSGQLQNIKAKPKVHVVVGINTAFSSKKRRDSVRETWMPQGDRLKRLEEEKGVVVRFVIGHSATPGGILDRAIEAENAVTNDFMRLVCCKMSSIGSLKDHVEGYHELSAKTKVFFSTAVQLWDANFYVKVDDDVHVNLGILASTLARHKSKPRVYIGCMKSGPVLAQQGVKYHEPEFWKFGEEGNRYFRHATGQIYALSKELANYVSINQAILHRYANEDVSLGSWFIGLDVDHIDDRSMCCGTPPDCEWKAQAGTMCMASFDWTCSGICKSVERMKDVHQRCGEGDDAVWSASY